MAKVYKLSFQELYEDPVAEEDRVLVGDNFICRMLCSPEALLQSLRDRLPELLEQRRALDSAAEESQPGALLFPLRGLGRAHLQVAALSHALTNAEHFLARVRAHLTEMRAIVAGNHMAPQVMRARLREVLQDLSSTVGFADLCGSATHRYHSSSEEYWQHLISGSLRALLRELVEREAERQGVPLGPGRAAATGRTARDILTGVLRPHHVGINEEVMSPGVAPPVVVGHHHAPPEVPPT